METITINGTEYVPAASIHQPPPKAPPVRIVVMHRGWVAVGRVHRDGEDIVITDARTIRRWGTSRGLGQLATDGPQARTQMDPQPTTRVHHLAVIQMIDVPDKQVQDALLT